MQEIDMYEVLLRIMEAYHKEGEINDLEFGVVSTELKYAKEKEFPFVTHQVEYTHKGKWLTSEFGKDEEKSALEKYKQVAVSRSLSPKPGTPFVKSKLYRMLFPDEAKKNALRDRMYS